ncbi:hypothetical protein SASC598O02_014530 [Snodgrassella alvi SCGC AB-598-O02]|nr:hypothetical protein SASC598O02_014530 [Snodgrassella alvi SCGC AB-598-O02]
MKIKTINHLTMSILLSFSVVVADAYKPSNFDKIQLKHKCENELSSSFRDFAGTPSCDKLKRIEIQENQPSIPVKMEN